jgi:hypothetical protein
MALFGCLSDGWEVLAYLLKKKMNRFIEKEDEPNALILDLMLPGRTGNEPLSTTKCMHLLPKSCIDRCFLKAESIESRVQAIESVFPISKKDWS